MPGSHKASPVNSDLIQKIAQNAYQTHIRFAPNEAKTAWHRLVEATTNKDRRGITAALQLAESAARKSLNVLCNELTKVSPSSSLELLFGEHPQKLNEYIMPKGAETVSLARGAWLIGVFASGDDASQYGALKAFNKYVRWVAAHLVKMQIETLSIDDAAERNITAARNQLEINRLVEPETRMMWITDEITRHIGTWVDSNTESTPFSEVFDYKTAILIGKNAQKAQLSAKESINNNSQKMGSAFSTILLEGIPEKLVHSLTTPRRDITETNVEHALKSESPTINPFVKIGDSTFVLGRSGWLMQRDDALIRLVMQASPRHKEGQVFEDVATSMLQEWGPRGVTWKSSVNLIGPRRKKDTDDLDVFGHSDELAFIGECKANRLSENNSSVGATFESTVLNKAITQLKTRMEHWRKGWRPDSDQRFELDDVSAFAITFSSYGGILWNGEKLREDDAAGQFSVIPLHSLILAASALEAPEDLKAYLGFRQESMAKGATNMDELEYMLSFIAAPEISSTAHSGNESETRILLRQYELSDRGIWLDPRDYSSYRDWKQRFRLELWEHSNAVTPPLQ